MHRYYVSEPGGTIRQAHVLEWGQWFDQMAKVPFDQGGRRVADTHVGEARVSTVFLGMDHGYGGGPPAAAKAAAELYDRCRLSLDWDRQHNGTA